ncbi:protein kinase [Novymonas esmeraldas]|uniref:non-specific serine/threonine protein kinase n=1 Tax=Novymonas esmeraldas TaxID=1808958 RepID=A0AAW0EUJ8_9TRYP
MSTKRGKAGDHTKTGSVASLRGVAAPVGAADKELGSSEEARNPLIDDLFDDLSQHSSVNSLQCPDQLKGESVSNHGSFGELGARLRRVSDDTMASGRSGARAQQLKATTDVICKTSQHFVHAMRMHQLDDYFAPMRGESNEDAVRRQLRSKSPQEVETVVIMLVELLEEVRKARGQVAPLTGSLSLLDGIGRERTLSSSMLSTVSTASMMRPPVHETNQVAMAYDNHGNRMINCYTVIAKLGKGAYGKVKLGTDASTGQKVAIKIIDKKHLKRKIGGVAANDQDAALKREIAIMKKVRHRNCVSLYEVIDDPDSNKLYLIMDYVPNGPVVRLKAQQLGSAALESIEAGIQLNGEVCNRALTRCAVRQSATGATAALTDAEITSNPTIFLCKPLSQHVCALYLRQLVSGLRYMHKRHLVHHDIKPDNILLGTDHHVFLTDFGVSEILSTRDEAKSGAGKDDEGNSDRSSASDDEDGSGGSGVRGPRLGGGTLLFTAPELFDSSVNQGTVDPYLTDVWALGVTLYCMLVGMSPFFGNSYPEVRSNILTQTYPWCGKSMHEAPLAAEWRVVLNGLLAKDPAKRWSLVRLKSFLDQESFQDAMRQSAVRESTLRLRPVTGFDSDASLTSSAAHRTIGSVTSLSVTTSIIGMRPPLVPGPPANGNNTALAQPRALSSSAAAVSVLSMEPGSAARNFLWDLGVSEQEVRDATRTVKVEVMRKKLVLSPHTRAVVRRYVESVRTSMQGRNFIQLSCSSPFRSVSGIGSPLSVHINGGASKTSSSGSNAVHVAHVPAHVPVLAVAAKFHRTSEVGPIGAGSLFYPPRKDSKPMTRMARSGTQPGADGGADSDHAAGDSAGAGGNLADRVLGCRTQSLDAILSIVNLQSTSHEHSLSFSFSSSSASSPDSFTSPRAHAGHRAGRAGGVGGVGRVGSPVVVRDHTRAPGSEMADTVMWSNARPPSTVAQPLVVSSDCHSLLSDEESRQRTSPGNGKVRFAQVSRRKITPGSVHLSEDRTSPYQATLAPKSRSPVSPPVESVLYNASGDVADGNVNCYQGSSQNPNATSTTSAFLALSPGKTSSVTRSPDALGSLYPAERTQHRLCEGRGAVPLLTSFEEVRHVVARRTRSSTIGK